MSDHEGRQLEGITDDAWQEVASLDRQIANLRETMEYLEVRRQSLLNGDQSAQPRPAVVPRKQKRNRPTMAEMANRNQTVAMATLTFSAEHGRPPDVHEIMTITGLKQKQVYATASYKEGKIARQSAVLTGELVTSAHETEHFGRTSTQHSRVNRRSKAEQAEVDALIEDQERDDKSFLVT